LGSEEPSEASTSNENTSPAASAVFVEKAVQVSMVPGCTVELKVQTMKGARFLLTLTTRLAAMVLRITPFTWKALLASSTAIHDAISLPAAVLFSSKRAR
jgi:hypothetical protein